MDVFEQFHHMIKQNANNEFCGLSACPTAYCKDCIFNKGNRATVLKEAEKLKKAAEILNIPTEEFIEQISKD